MQSITLYWTESVYTQPCGVARNGTEISGHVTVLSLANSMLLHRSPGQPDLPMTQRGQPHHQYQQCVL